MTLFVRFVIIENESGEEGSTAYQIDETDIKIIRLLQEEGRRPNVDIAHNVGISEATVRKRLNRLFSERIIKVVGMVAPARVGLPKETIIFLQVELAQLDEVTAKLAQMPETRSLRYTTGEYDMVLEAFFPSDEALLQFLTRRLAPIAGIRRTATAHVLRAIKRVEEWQLPLGEERDQIQE